VDDWVMLESWVYDFGGSYVDDVKHPTHWTFAEDPHTLEGIQFRSDLINKYKVMLPPSSISAMGGLGNADLFLNGEAAMFLSGIWKTPAFRNIKKFKWDVVMLPKGPNNYRAFSTGGSGYGILKSSSYKKEAWELVQFISGEEGAKKLASTGLAQPALMKIANSPNFLDGQDPVNKKMLLEAIKYVKYGPLCENWTEIQSGIIGPELEKVWSGTETPEQAMANLKPMLEAKPPKTK
jgi:multiple sugar transport system substrate-binding protein